jgi:hypothetical protein
MGSIEGGIMTHKKKVTIGDCVITQDLQNKIIELEERLKYEHDAAMEMYHTLKFIEPVNYREHSSLITQHAGATAYRFMCAANRNKTWWTHTTPEKPAIIERMTQEKLI